MDSQCSEKSRNRRLLAAPLSSHFSDPSGQERMVTLHPSAMAGGNHEAEM